MYNETKLLTSDLYFCLTYTRMFSDIYANSVECLEIKSYGGSCQAKTFMIMLATEMFNTVQFRVINKLDKCKTDHIRLGNRAHIRE